VAGRSRDRGSTSRVHRRPPSVPTRPWRKYRVPIVPCRRGRGRGLADDVVVTTTTPPRPASAYRTLPDRRSPTKNLVADGTWYDGLGRRERGRL
jgi:hypothetical protein